MNLVKNYQVMRFENAIENKMASKTSAATTYAITHNRRTIKIIDTPGFGDSRGFDVDKEHAKKIINAIEEATYINAIVLVVNGRDSRMTASLKYVLQEIASMMPQKVLKNTLAVLTNAVSVLDLNFDVKELDKFFNFDVPFRCVDNPVARVEKAKALRAEISHTSDFDLFEKSLARSFEDASEFFCRFFGLLAPMSPVHTNAFLTVYQRKGEIESSLVQILAKMRSEHENGQRQQRAKKDLQEAVATRELNSDYKTTREATECSRPP